MKNQLLSQRKVRRTEAKSKMKYDRLCESALSKPTTVTSLEDLLSLSRTPDYSAEPAHHRDLHGDTPPAVRIGCYQSDLQIFDRAQNLIGSPFVYVATEMATGILIATETQLRPPDTMTMEYFCRRVLRQLRATPARVSFLADYTVGINWDRIAMKLRLCIASNTPVRRYPPMALDEFRLPVRVRTSL